MSNSQQHKPLSQWSAYERGFFRFFFLYFIVQVIPWDGKFYQQAAAIDWRHLQYGDIFNLAHYTPRFLGNAPSYINWVIAAAIALAGAGLWTWTDRGRHRDYTQLYYWLRVLLRYRLSLALLAYGFIMLFPVQAPYPSISNLNTPYGDFTRWKLFSLSLGVVPSFEFFLGLTEVLLGLLLLYRKTASLAAFVITIYLGNVFVSNLAYEGGEDVYSLFLISLAAFILAYDAKRIYRLLVLQKPTAPNRFRPAFKIPGQYARIALKTLFVLFFVVLYGFKTADGYRQGSYQFPQTKGLPGTAGLYQVTLFRQNQDTITYSPAHPTRWQDVVWEEWNTISIRSNRPVAPDSNNTDHIYAGDAHRTYELEGTAARHYYSYTADTIQRVLLLQNRNHHYAGETLVLQYDRLPGNRIVLRGINQDQDSILVILDRSDKQYLLKEAAKAGRRKGLKL